MPFNLRLVDITELIWSLSFLLYAMDTSLSITVGMPSRASINKMPIIWFDKLIIPRPSAPIVLLKKILMSTPRTNPAICTKVV